MLKRTEPLRPRGGATFSLATVLAGVYKEANRAPVPSRMSTAAKTFVRPTRNGAAYVGKAGGREIVYERSRDQVKADLARAAGFRDFKG